MKPILLTLALLMLMFACDNPATKESEPKQDAENMLSEQEQTFFDHLRALCGNSYAGEETFMAEGRESWAHYDFIMHVTVCTDNRVHIPFHLSDDHSRTWLFLIEDGKLRFRHDHHHEDGTPEDQTLYGGYASGKGTAFVQHFPADEYTVELLQDTLGRQWDIRLEENLSRMTYQLRYHGELVFEAAFDLTGPI